jgi:hypothetical protein
VQDWRLRSHTTMESFRITLSPAQFAELNECFPVSQGSAQIGKRAVELIKIHFVGRDPDCKFVPAKRGADLAVVVGESPARQFEVKGTSGSEIAWQKLKVSSKPSYDLLTSGEATVLRVTNVFGQEPVVHELKCGRDFRLDHEPRWSVKPVRES